MIFLELFFTFFIIGMFTIGGGYAMLSLIQNEVVTVHGWITDTTFTDIVAISQMTPGPIGINSATYVGYEVLAQSGASEFMCILGSFTATFAVVIPSFMIVLMLCKVYEKWKEHYMFKGIMAGLCAGLVYRLFEKKNRYLAVIAGAVVAPVVNTGIFLLGCFAFFMDAVNGGAAAQGMSVGAYLIIFFVGLNFVFELLTNIVLAPTILKILNIKQKQN